MHEKLDRLSLKAIDVGSASVKRFNRRYVLSVDGNPWMVYDVDTKQQLNEFQAEFDLAYGDVVLSGLGLGLLPRMLLEKPDVNSITVYEAFKDVIEINEYLGIPEGVKVVHSRMEDVVDVRCDCMFLDHYEFESDEYLISQTRKIASQNHADVVWFWRSEPMILKAISNKHLDYSSLYQEWADSTGIKGLPRLTTQKVREYVGVYHKSRRD